MNVCVYRFFIESGLWTCIAKPGENVALDQISDPGLEFCLHSQAAFHIFISNSEYITDLCETGLNRGQTERKHSETTGEVHIISGINH